MRKVCRVVCFCALAIGLLAGNASTQEGIPAEWVVDGTSLWNPGKDAAARWLTNATNWRRSRREIDDGLLGMRCFIADRDGELLWSCVFAVKEASRDGERVCEADLTTTFRGSVISCRSVFSIELDELTATLVFDQTPAGKKVKRVRRKVTINPEDAAGARKTDRMLGLLSDEFLYILALAKAPEGVYLVPSFDVDSRRAGSTVFRVIPTTAGGADAVKVLVASIVEEPDRVSRGASGEWLFDADGKLLRGEIVNQPELLPLREIPTADWLRRWGRAADALGRKSVEENPQKKED